MHINSQFEPRIRANVELQKKYGVNIIDLDECFLKDLVGYFGCFLPGQFLAGQWSAHTN